MKVHAKAEELKDLLVDIVDAIVDGVEAEHSMAKARAKAGDGGLPNELIEALGQYLRMEHAECPRCGKRTRASLVLNEGSCLECWREKKVELDSQDEA